MKRSALIAIAIIMVVYQYHEILSKNASKSAIICLLLAVIVGLYLLRNYFVDLVNMNLDRLYSVSEDQGSGRTKVWSDAIDALSNSSVLEFFFGSGVDSTLIRAHHTSAHNDFLTLFLEFGVFGIALYISFWIHLIKQFITLKRSKSIYYMSWFASMTILIVVGGVGDLFTSYVYLPLITVVLGIVDAKVLNEKYATNRRV